MSIFSRVYLCPSIFIWFHLQLSCTFLICPKISFHSQTNLSRALDKSPVWPLNLDACIYIWNFILWTILHPKLAFPPDLFLCVSGQVILQITETEALGIVLGHALFLVPTCSPYDPRMSFPTFSPLLLPFLETMPLLPPSRTAASACSIQASSFLRITHLPNGLIF